MRKTKRLIKLLDSNNNTMIEEAVLKGEKVAIAEPEFMADYLYACARLEAAHSLAPNRERTILRKIYGSRWYRAESLPRTKSTREIQELLKMWSPPRGCSAAVMEEYKRLDRAVGYSRKVLCLDMDGFLIEDDRVPKKMTKLVEKLRQVHEVVVTTAAPESEAYDMLKRHRVARFISHVFGEVGHPKGKLYLPTSEHYNFPHPEEKLIAIGHSQEDAPADMNIPFIIVESLASERAYLLEQKLREFLG